MGDVNRLDAWLCDLFCCPDVNDFCMALVAMVCWEIWKARCSFVFENLSPGPVLVGDKALSLFNEFWMANGWFLDNAVIFSGVNEVQVANWFL